MTVVKPFIKCVDYWPLKIPDNKLAAYKALIQAGQIVKHSVIYNQRTGCTTIEYSSTVPHQWIRQELAELAKRGY